tara:strand:- start:790 stop:1137 length:348 start_codon:yes stop_codon:yes gene_type:complete
MTITYTWDCKVVDVHPTEGSNTDVVYNVNWRLTGISDEKDSKGEFYQTTTISTQTVPAPAAGASFIPFADLTNDIVTGWTKTAMGDVQVAKLEAGIEAQIVLLITPVSVTMTVGA